MGKAALLIAALTDLFQSLPPSPPAETLRGLIQVKSKI
jgi:hypothetical protein